MNDNKITGAKNVLLLIRSGNEEATMDEIGLINDHIQREAGNTADIIFGVGTDAELGDSISVLVIATGFAADDQKYAGPTEKIRYTLEDSPSTPKVKRESPFGRTSTEKSQENPMQNSSKSMFFLDDSNDSSTTDFPSNSVNQFAETQAAVMEERIEELRFFEDESLSIESSHQTFEVEEQENNVLELFSFDDEDVLESQSFTFETEEKKTTIIEKTQFNAAQEVENVKLSMEETKEEISFIVEEKTAETYRPKAETKTLVEEKPIEFTFKIAEEIAEVKTVFENHTEEKITFTENRIEEEFKFIEKNTATEKIQARRDKLKEFNSRYQTIENENEFENIPAFRRKNINIGHENASQQQISSFLSENNGRVQLRENKFLNKDVD